MSQKLPPSRTAPQFVVRFPDETMRDRIREVAERNNRSMNAEIIARLEASFDPSQGSAGFLGDSIHDILGRSTRGVESALELEESLRNAAHISESLKNIDFTAIESFAKTLESMAKATHQLDEKNMELIKKLSTQSASDTLQEKIDQMEAQRSTEKANPKKRP